MVRFKKIFSTPQVVFVPMIAFYGLCGFATSALSSASTNGDEAVNVVASSSLGSVIAELAREYSRETGVHIAVNFGVPSVLAKNIFEGGRADVFISDDPEWIESLQQEGMVDVYSSGTFAETSLEVICGGEKPEDSSLNGVMQARKDSFRLAVCDIDNSPLGIYSKELVEKLKLPLKVRDQITEIGSLESLADVINKEQICGVFYSFSGMNNRAALWKAPVAEEVLPRIQIKAAVVAGENMQAARDFVDYLKGDRAEKIISAAGLTPGPLDH